MERLPSWVIDLAKTHGAIIWLLIQLVILIVYWQADPEPFVYIKF